MPLSNRKGITLVDQMTTLVLLGLLMAVAVGSGVRLADSAAVHAATREVTDAFAFARDRAVAGSSRTAVRIETTTGRVLVHSASDTLLRLEPGPTHRVHLESTRDSMAYAPNGLGWGAANLRIIVSRGAEADTITLSRLGRVKS